MYIYSVTFFSLHFSEVLATCHIEYIPPEALLHCFASFRVVDAVDLDSQTGVPRGRLQASCACFWKSILRNANSDDI